MAIFRALREIQLPESIEGVLPFLRALQDAVSDSVGPLTNVPLLDYVWKRDVALASGANQIGHGLGRPWRGYIVTRRNAAVTVHDPDEQPMRDRLVTLQSSGAAVVDLFMF